MPSRAQMPLPGITDPPPDAAPNPLADPTVNAGKVELFGLEARFAADVAEHGGKAFAAWFADDGVVLSNGQAPVMGRAAIEKASRWLPSDYQLMWSVTDAVMGPSGDMGYTWGHFEGHSHDAHGHERVVEGRYMTIWRKQKDGNWRVVLDAGAEEPAESPDCCRLAH